jgi:hypothetical protein
VCSVQLCILGIAMFVLDSYVYWGQLRVFWTAMCIEDSYMCSGQLCVLGTVMCIEDVYVCSRQLCVLETAMCIRDSYVCSGQLCVLGTSMCIRVTVSIRWVVFVFLLFVKVVRSVSSYCFICNYEMIYLLTEIGLSPGGCDSSTA